MNGATQEGEHKAMQEKDLFASKSSKLLMPLLFPLVYGVSNQEEMLATLMIFLFHFACNIAYRVDNDGDVRLMTIL
ncbi:hypothetical protein RHMOL_Rhmol09G0111700 [Rhododendron molle]|uniref:Uncharacterized protein n=1 Tax=Rhododendron molle TaxID=49168 RepID=A0ACC0MDH2_RHOML|nr:hypothetical protein RHMOL_Rhmol09G0111700 [Rhododendron molle]